MIRKSGRLLALVAAAGLLIGCASYPVNEPTDRVDTKSGYRFDTLKADGNTESLFVILTFSGGGTRAAALSYGVMEKLRDTTIHWKGQEKRLLDEVDVISSVSGGSFTAAYYGLFRERLFAEEQGFRDRFLYRDIEGELIAELFNPVNLLKLASPTYGRIELASELYNHEIFENRSFSDMEKEGRPFIMLNATDMSEGAPFTFVQSQFDLLCSDLGSYKVARAVAASSDFPVAFTPLQINNYADRCVYDKPKWVTMAEKDRDFSANPRRNARARVAWSYRDAAKRPFIHLLDGGVADNIGFRGPPTAITSNDSPWSLPNRINARNPDGSSKIEKLVVIIVDAKTRPKTKFDLDPSPPGLLTVLETISTVPLDNYSFGTIERLKAEFKQWQKDRRSLWKDRNDAFRSCPPPPDNLTPAGLRPLDLYAVYVGFDQIADGQEYFGHDREWYLTRKTSFVLEKDTIDDLRKVGGALLDDSEPFQGLVDCLKQP